MWPNTLFHLASGLVLATADDEPTCLSSMYKGAAIGDSYTAGIGAGNLVDWSCSRYDSSFANLVAMQLGVPTDQQEFTYKACSGAVVSQVREQAQALDPNQQYIIMSAGGNDAGLVGILNSCVFSFSGLHQNCDAAIDSAYRIILSSDFSSSLDGLISDTKMKLSSEGRIFYVGYARFFDTSDTACDEVSWHIWGNLFSREYLTQERRTRMNNLVVLMNDALRAATLRAGAQVYFIEYDEDVERAGGSFCQPGQDESDGNSANRDDLFFYEMQTSDTPMSEYYSDWSTDAGNSDAHYENGSHDVIPANNSLNAQYGALIQEAIDDLPGQAVLEEDNVNPDLEQEVAEWHDPTPSRRRLRSHSYLRPLHSGPNRPRHGRNLNISEKSEAISASFFIPSSVARIFHPTQVGHSLISNKILWQMEADCEQRLGFDMGLAVVEANNDIAPWLEGPWCTSDSSNFWTDRDPMRDAANQFCAEPQNLRGLEERSTKTRHYADTLNYLELTIEWIQTTNIGQHICISGFSSITDSCDIPALEGPNLKHGGNMTHHNGSSLWSFMRIEPLVMRRIWNGGKITTPPQCNSIQSTQYVDQSLLQGQIDGHCDRMAVDKMGFVNAGSNFTSDFYEGTPSHVQFQTLYPVSSHFEFFLDECLYYMNVVLNGCSLSGPENPRNLKHGGGIAGNNDVQYSITPLHPRAPPPAEPQGSCKTFWNGNAFTYQIFGSGWSSADYGEELKLQITYCWAFSAPSEYWQFDYFDTPNADGMEWYATGTVPAGIDDGCVGRAIASAGGFDRYC